MFAQSHPPSLLLIASQFIDYTAGPLHQALIKIAPSPKVHLIFDAIGLSDPSLYANSRAYMVPNGLYVNVTPKPSFTLRGIAEISSLIFRAYLHPRWLGGVPSGFKWVITHDAPVAIKISDAIYQNGFY